MTEKATFKFNAHISGVATTSGPSDKLTDWLCHTEEVHNHFLKNCHQQTWFYNKPIKCWEIFISFLF